MTVKPQKRSGALTTEAVSYDQAATGSRSTALITLAKRLSKLVSQSLHWFSHVDITRITTFSEKLIGELLVRQVNFQHDHL